MSKPIKCPKCGADVVLRKFGFVSEHQRADNPQRFCEQSGMRLPGWKPAKQTDPLDAADAPEWYKRIVGAEADILAQTEQDRDDTRQREASLQQTIADILTVLFNEAGLERLANITDEEWEGAESEDDKG